MIIVVGKKYHFTTSLDNTDIYQYERKKEGRMMDIFSFFS